MIPWWLKLAALGALVLVLLGLKHAYDEGKRDEGRAEVQAKWDADKAARIRAFSDMTSKWATEQQRADALQKEKDDARNIAANRARARAAAIPAGDASVRIPASAIRVLNDAVADSTISPGAAGKPAEGATAATADSDVAALVQWGLTCVDLYSQARDTVIGWVAYYSRLRAAQPEVKP